MGMKTLKVDAYKRIRLPDVEPGTIFAYSNNGHGTIMLTQIKPKMEGAFPPGSLLKYLTPEWEAEQLAILEGIARNVLNSKDKRTAH